MKHLIKTSLVLLSLSFFALIIKAQHFTAGELAYARHYRITPQVTDTNSGIYILYLVSAQWTLTNVVTPAGIEFYGIDVPGGSGTNISDTEFTYVDLVTGAVSGSVSNNVLTAATALSGQDYIDDIAGPGYFGNGIIAMQFDGIMTNSIYEGEVAFNVNWSANVSSSFATSDGTSLTIQIDGGDTYSFVTNFPASGTYSGVIEIPAATNRVYLLQVETRSTTINDETSSHSISTTVSFDWIQ